MNPSISKLFKAQVAFEDDALLMPKGGKDRVRNTTATIFGAKPTAILFSQDYRAKLMYRFSS